MGTRSVSKCSTLQYQFIKAFGQYRNTKLLDSSRNLSRDKLIKDVWFELNVLACVTVINIYMSGW